MQPGQEEQTRERQWAAGCDPFTLVEVARKGLYDPSQAKDPHIEAATVEIVSRFELQQRAGLGSSVLAGASASQQQ